MSEWESGGPTRTELEAASDLYDRLAEGRPAVPPWRCVGLAGRLLGHRFLNFISRETEFCLRCGMPTGGWKP